MMRECAPHSCISQQKLDLAQRRAELTALQAPSGDLLPRVNTDTSHINHPFPLRMSFLFPHRYIRDSVRAAAPIKSGHSSSPSGFVICLLEITACIL